MKVRNFKFITSVLSLMFVLAIMSVGVWASAGQVVNIRTTVSFMATGVSGTITGTLTGVGDEVFYYNSTSAAGGEAIAFNPSGTELADWTLGSDDTPLMINTTDGIPANIVYEFTITNSSTTDDIVIELVNLAAGNNLEVVSVVQDDAEITRASDDVDYVLNNIAESTDSTVVITFKVANEGVSIVGEDLSFTLNLVSANAVTGTDDET